MKVNAKVAAKPRNLGAALAQSLPLVAAVALVALMVVPEIASASSASTGMPWESGLDKFVKSLTGPVAMSISILAFAGCMIGLIFGGEMSDFMRKGVIVIMCMCGLIGVAGIVTLFTGSGAVIALGGLAGFA